MSAATFSPASTLRSATTTDAPSAASAVAYASPIPCAAPVTTTTLFSNLAHAGSAIVLVSRYSSKPATPISRPIPDCL